MEIYIKGRSQTEIYGMARIGYISKSRVKGKEDKAYEIYVNTNDAGNRPHFHFRDTATQGSGKDGFHTCIDILSPTYFHHEGKNDYLDSGLKKSLVRFLKSPYVRFNVSTWKYLVGEWNNNNSNMEVDDDVEMPNYLLLPNKIG
jgi:hypothetical protein